MDRICEETGEMMVKGVGNKRIDEYVCSPNFLDRVIKECGKRIEGEQEAIKVLLICSHGRLVTNSYPTSYNLLVNSESGAGKDYVTSKVLELLPKDDYHKRTRISPTAFTYWHNAEKEPNWTWDGKTLYLEDISNGVLNSDVLKVMCSGGTHATIVVNQVAKDLLVRGKPVIIVTSASANPNPELLRRFSLLNLDESVDQTEAILHKTAKFAVDGISPEYEDNLKIALRQLKPQKVKIPYARELVQDFPSNHLVIRTHWGRFLDLMKASAVFHQYQREIDNGGFLLANGQDYDVARDILIKTTTNTSMIPLTKDQQRIIQVFQKLDRESLEPGRYSISDLEPHVNFCQTRWLRENLKRLANYKILEADSERRDNSIKPVLIYSLKENLGDVFLPTWKELSCRNQTSNTHSAYNTNNENSANKEESIDSSSSARFAPCALKNRDTEVPHGV